VSARTVQVGDYTSAACGGWLMLNAADQVVAGDFVSEALDGWLKLASLTGPLSFRLGKPPVEIALADPPLSVRLGKPPISFDWST